MLTALKGQIRKWLKPPTLGECGERAAIRHLRKLGYIIVAHSIRDRAGEIDIVAVDRRTIIFVEVKARSSDIAGQPVEAVDENKQHRVARMALRYLKRHDLLEQRWRFDIVAVTWPKGRRRPAIKHLPSAFEPSDIGQMFS